MNARLYGNARFEAADLLTIAGSILNHLPSRPISECASGMCYSRPRLATAAPSSPVHIREVRQNAESRGMLILQVGYNGDKLSLQAAFSGGDLLGHGCLGMVAVMLSPSFRAAPLDSHNRPRSSAACSCSTKGRTTACAGSSKAVHGCAA